MCHPLTTLSLLQRGLTLFPPLFCKPLSFASILYTFSCEITSIFIKRENRSCEGCSDVHTCVHRGEPTDESGTSVCSMSIAAVSSFWLPASFNSSVGGLRFCRGTGAALTLKYRTRGSKYCVCVLSCVYCICVSIALSALI